MSSYATTRFLWLCKGTDSKEKVHCMQSSYRHLNYTEFIKNYIFSSKICIVLNRLITFWNYSSIFRQVCWNFSRNGLDQLKYSSFANFVNGEKWFLFPSISHASYNQSIGNVHHISECITNTQRQTVRALSCTVPKSTLQNICDALFACQMSTLFVNLQKKLKQSGAQR
jgi:hypothetical protein